MLIFIPYSGMNGRFEKFFISPNFNQTQTNGVIYYVLKIIKY